MKNLLSRSFRHSNHSQLPLNQRHRKHRLCQLHHHHHNQPPKPNQETNYLRFSFSLPMKVGSPVTGAVTVVIHRSSRNRLIALGYVHTIVIAKDSLDLIEITLLNGPSPRCRVVRTMLVVDLLDFCNHKLSPTTNPRKSYREIRTIHNNLCHGTIIRGLYRCSGHFHTLCDSFISLTLNVFHVTLIAGPELSHNRKEFLRMLRIRTVGITIPTVARLGNTGNLHHCTETVRATESLEV